MPGKLFGRTNTNDILFNVEQQEGADESDTNVASIGDATLAHIQNLSSSARMTYDEHFSMADGNIFRIMEELRWDDPNEFNLTQKDELDIYMRSHKIPEKLRPVVEEAIQRQQGDDPDYEDVMDHKEDLVPYHEWEKFPGQWQRWDIPTTPRKRLQYCGNSKAIFYDQMPEGHPMDDMLVRILVSLDQFKWENILTMKQIKEYNATAKEPMWTDDNMRPSWLWTDGKQSYMEIEVFIKSYRRIIFSSKAHYEYKVNVYENMREMALEIADGHTFPCDVAEVFLKKVEDFWTKQYLLGSYKATQEKDPIYHYLRTEGMKLTALAKSGEQVYNRLKKIGRDLYQKGFLCKKNVFIGDQGTHTNSRVNERDPDAIWEWQTIVDRPRKRHWQKYRAIEAELLKIMKQRATRRKVGQFALALMKKITATAEKALGTRNLKDYTKVAQILINMDQARKLECSKKEMSIVWEHYSKEKTRLLNALTHNESKTEATG